MIKLFILYVLFINGTYQLKVDPKESSVTWTGSKIIGSSHHGTVSIKEGNLQIDDQGALQGGSFTIDMTSIANTDLSGKYKTKLEQHLRSEDFFGVEKFPEANFIISQTVASGEGKYVVTGDITIKGKTETISFNAELVKQGENYLATAQFPINRSRFDVRYGSNSFFDNLGDRAIDDVFILDIRVVALR